LIASGAGGRRVTGWAAFAAGLGALAAGLAVMTGPVRPPADAGTTPPPVTVPAARGPVPVAAPVRQLFTPSRVTIAGRRIAAPVEPVGVRSGGALAIPEDPGRLGWWIGSALPGARRGTVVVAGHVDTATRGAGALFRLEQVSMGARIDVRAGGRTIRYTAVARRSYPKRRLPAELFRTDTAPRLVLITCGGAFHDGSYSHNVVLFAEPRDTRP
jgi:hypothetical protein